MYFLQTPERYAEAFIAAKNACGALRGEPDDGVENSYGVSICPLMNEVSTEVIKQGLLMADVPYMLGKAYSDDDCFLVQLTHGKASLRDRTAELALEVLRERGVRVDFYFGPDNTSYGNWQPK